MSGIRCHSTSEQLESLLVLSVLNGSNHRESSQGEFLITVESSDACHRFKLSIRQERLKQVCADCKVVDKIFSLKNQYVATKCTKLGNQEAVVLS